VTLLERPGVDVEVPLAQTCCGQMHTNTGYGRLAAPLAVGFAETFSGFDAVVTPSASCAGSIRHQHPALVAGTAAEERVRAVGSRVYELSEFIVDVLGVEDVGARYPHRVTYHPTCHGLRLLRLQDRPLRLLRNVRDLELVTLPDAETCCGFGGTFAVKNSDVSAAMLADKVSSIQATGAAYCTAGDASCLMHMDGGLRRLPDTTLSRPRTVHLVEILAAT
jgi:L-lactate dehydrogenase complex protein LldE